MAEGNSARTCLGADEAMLGARNARPTASPRSESGAPSADLANGMIVDTALISGM